MVLQISWFVEQKLIKLLLKVSEKKEIWILPKVINFLCMHKCVKSLKSNRQKYWPWAFPSQRENKTAEAHMPNLAILPWDFRFESPKLLNVPWSLFSLWPLHCIYIHVGIISQEACHQNMQDSCSFKAKKTPEVCKKAQAKFCKLSDWILE